MGNPAFAIGLEDAPASSIAVLFVSLDVEERVVDGCTFWPRLPALLAATVTGGGGTASAQLPVPALPYLAGAQLWAQWGVIQPGGPVFGFVAPSDALFVQIGR